MTILEAFHTLLLNGTIASDQADQSMEFHGYADEEAGLLGSAAVWRSYAEQGRNIAVMLNQDMTEYTAGYTSRQMKPKVGIIIEYVDVPLTSLMRRIIAVYTDAEKGDLVCGYACSDHAAAFVLESEISKDYLNPKHHATRDTADIIEFAYMLELARMAVGLAVEPTFAA